MLQQPIVLIVEDDPVVRIVFKKLVSRLGYTSYEAGNGLEALNMVDQHPEINHIFLDLNMPVMDGYGFLHYLSSGKNHQQVHVFITSVTDESDFRNMMEQNNTPMSMIKGYNRKPFDMAQLANSLTLYQKSIV